MAEPSVALPNQNQLFAYYMHLCGQHRIRKPTKAVLALLEEDDASRDIRRRGEAKALFLDVADLPDDGGEGHEAQAARAAIVPLAQRRELAFDDPTAHFGNAGVCALLDLLAECPLLESLDLRGVGSFYRADAFKLGPSGNEVVERLAKWAAEHPSVRAIDLRGQPIGTAAGATLVTMLHRSPGVTTLLYDEEGVDTRVQTEIAKALDKNRRGANASPKVPLPARLSERVLALGDVDRKSSRELQALHLLLWELRDAFAPIGAAALGDLVLRARPVSLSEVVRDCRGLRGDEAHIYVIESGAIHATIGTQASVLGRGDYFGEPLESIMYSGGTLSVAARGTAFRIPFAACGGLFAAWEQRVATHLPAIRSAVCLQALPLWALIRACHEAELVEFSRGEPLVPLHAPFAGLLLILSGSAVCAGRKAHRVEFGRGDLVGEEAAVCKMGSSSVAIVAECAEGECVTALRLGTRFSHEHIVRPLRGVFRLQARQYSLHDDI